MLIDQISLFNFRVYSGLQKLHLAQEINSKITVIAGNNGYGKTSFLTSLVWALYGKLMVDVDDKYRQDIQECGGYKRYCEQLMNRAMLAEGESKLPELIELLQHTNSPAKKKELKAEIDSYTSFSVTIAFTEVFIPAVPCQRLEIRRTYNTRNHHEQVDIIIDGRLNELTRDTGPDIFINDFVLPKEIAKFFFFDAEKIVSLAEIKSAEEKRYLSQAYAEVLGIKKYTDLKANLTNMRLRLRKGSAVKADRDVLDRLTAQLTKNRKLVELYQQQIADKTETIHVNKVASDKYQEKLIREGSTITLEDFKKLKEQQNQIQQDQQKVKSNFNELIELAPFAILARKLDKVKQQVESEMTSSAVSRTSIENKFKAIADVINNTGTLSNIEQNDKNEVLRLVQETLMPSTDVVAKPLLDFTTEQQNQFLGIYDHLHNTYSKKLKGVVMEQRRLQSVGGSLQRKLQNAEAKEKDPLVAEIRAAKQEVDDILKQLEADLVILHSKKQHVEIEIQTAARKISELSHKINVEDKDVEKDNVAKRLIDKLDLFIIHLKTKKKASLEENIQAELNSLMHKEDFVKKVDVIIEGELIDIELYDQDGAFINKDMLSKGEQQLYATALLKALINESNIHFPVFIDSPLQKFDQMHSGNIIRDFYPGLSSQVILFPLLQKELNEAEYNLLINRVGRAYLIEQHDNYRSGFVEVEPENLFNAVMEGRK